jgi:hypothetical protein
MIAAYFKELVALLMIGEGVVGTLYPEQYARMWATGPRGWREFIDWWADRPRLMRWMCGAELCAGLWLATRQFAAADVAAHRLERKQIAGRADASRR